MATHPLAHPGCAAMPPETPPRRCPGPREGQFDVLPSGHGRKVAIIEVFEVRSSCAAWSHYPICIRGQPPRYACLPRAEPHPPEPHDRRSTLGDSDAIPPPLGCVNSRDGAESPETIEFRRRRSRFPAKAPVPRVRSGVSPVSYRSVEGDACCGGRLAVADTGDGPMRVAADLMVAAAIAGAREGRSAEQQLEHWARVGRSVCAHHVAARMRVEAALAGTLELSGLSREEAVTFNAEVQAEIEGALQATHLGEALNASGIATVSLDENGNLVEHRPDGTSAPPASG